MVIFLYNDKETSLWMSAINMSMNEDDTIIYAIDDFIIDEETEEILKIEDGLIS